MKLFNISVFIEKKNFKEYKILIIKIFSIFGQIDDIRKHFSNRQFLLKITFATNKCIVCTQKALDSIANLTNYKMSIFILLFSSPKNSKKCFVKHIEQILAYIDIT